MVPDMREPAANPIEPPPLTPEELEEIRALLEQVRRGDYSGTIPWEEIAKEFDLRVLTGRRVREQLEGAPPELRGYVDGVVALLRGGPGRRI
jgi:hypothetical protein